MEYLFMYILSVMIDTFTANPITSWIEVYHLSVPVPSSDKLYVYKCNFSVQMSLKSREMINVTCQSLKE
jgi:hypothetical protein